MVIQEKQGRRHPENIGTTQDKMDTIRNYNQVGCRMSTRRNRKQQPIETDEIINYLSYTTYGYMQEQTVQIVPLKVSSKIIHGIANQIGQYYFQYNCYLLSTYVALQQILVGQKPRHNFHPISAAYVSGTGKGGSM